MVCPAKNVPFVFCSHLLCLLAASNANQCNACQADFSYYSTESTFVRKRRKPKPAELKAPPVNHVWELGNQSRTAKHKRRHFTPDSGATVSVTDDMSIFHTVDDVSPNVYVQVANRQRVKASAIGTVKLTFNDSNGKPYTVLLSNVLYSPHFSGNLLSVEALYAQHKIATVFQGKKAHFLTSDGTHIPFAADEARRYTIRAYSVEHDSVMLWHRRFMHAGSAALRRLGDVIPCLAPTTYDFKECDACLQGGAKRLPFGVQAKRRNIPTSRKVQRFTYFGQRIASDLCGPFPKGINGEQYACIFHDSFSKYVCVYCINDKSRESVLQAFERFLSDHQEVLPNGVKQFWTDNGGEYCNEDMDAFCEELRINRTLTVPHLSQQNPYAERAWGTLQKHLRSSLIESGVDHRFWSYGIEQAALVTNILPDDNGVSPYERVYGKKYDYTSLHVIFSLCYYLVPDKDRPSRLSPRALPAIYLGPDKHRNGHYVYVPSMQRLTSSYHLVFNEQRYYNKDVDRARVTFDDQPPEKFNPPRHRTPDAINHRTPDAIPDHHRHHDNEPQHVATPQNAGDPDHSTDGRWNQDHCENSRCIFPSGHEGACSHERVESRFRNRPTTQYSNRVYSECPNPRCVFHADHCGKCEDEHACTSDPEVQGMQLEPDSVLDFNPMETSFSIIVDDVQHQVLHVDMARDIGDVPCPDSYQDAQSSPLKQKWKDSMLEEYEALIGNNTWELVSRNDERLRRRKPAKSRWVYTIKYNRDGTISRFKSRFVVCGYSQRQGVDYDRAFSATLRASSFRTLLAIAAGKKMRLMQFDVSNAFTQANMDDVDVFVEPPKGFETYESIGGKRVSKLLYLRRALYGTKQASRLWQLELRSFLESPKIGFECSKADPCLYRLSRGDEEIILGVYVDDIILAYRGDKLYKEFETKFFQRFPGKKNVLSWFLGMAIDQHDDFSIHVDHTLSISKMAAKYIPNNQPSRDFPSQDLFNKLDRAQNDEERAKAQQYNYASLVGALLYVGCMSNPAIAYHTSILAKFLSDPSPDCCRAAEQLLQYLVHNPRRMHFSGKIEIPDGLEMHGSDITRNFGFVAYSDSSWGNKYPYPMFGYGVYLYGSLVSYASKQLKTVAFSSCEAEYAAASFACKEIMFIRSVCKDMGVCLQDRLILAVDNTAAIDIAHDVGVSARTKHFDRAIHYLRDLTQTRHVLPAYVNTFRQRADGFTKALDKQTFLKWVAHVSSAISK